MSNNRRGRFFGFRSEVMKYVTDVASLFLDRCPEITILGPEDFTIIAEWEKQEIPFEVVVRSINETCDRSSEDRAKIKSIADFQRSVKKNYLEWLKD